MNTRAPAGHPYTYGIIRLDLVNVSPEEKIKHSQQRDLSFHFYDFPRTLWRVQKDRHVYEAFQMAPFCPHPGPLFSSLAMKD